MSLAVSMRLIESLDKSQRLADVLCVIHALQADFKTTVSKEGGC